MNDKTYKPFICCGSWSDYSSEREYLFLGGLQPLIFTTIRDIPTNTNYQKWIQPISMLQSMIRGAPIITRQATKSDVKYLFWLLVDCVLTKELFLSIGCCLKKLGLKQYKKKKKPPFIINLFKHFIVNVKEVMINLRFMNVEEIWGDYGFKLFLPLFFDVLDSSRPNMKLFLSIFTNLEKFVIFTMVYSNRKWKYGSTINLDDNFCNDIFGAINILKERNLKSNLKYIAITKPKSSIYKFINNHKDKFNQLNFTLYSHQYTHSFFGECKECLYIAPNN